METYRSGAFDVFRVVLSSGPHKGHSCEVWHALHPCGVEQVDIFCQCGAAYFNRMAGCWQMGHQRPEEGDPTLRSALSAIPPESTLL